MPKLCDWLSERLNQTDVLYHYYLLFFVVGVFFVIVGFEIFFIISLSKKIHFAADLSQMFTDLITVLKPAEKAHTWKSFKEQETIETFYLFYH